VIEKREAVTIPGEEAMVGQMVLMKRKNPSSKIHPIWLGPFIISKVEGNNVLIKEIDSSKSIKVHISMLRKCNYDSDINDMVSPEELAAKDRQEFIVHSITDYNPATKLFRVHWQSSTTDEDTWEPIEHLSQRNVIVDALYKFLVDHPELLKQRKYKYIVNTYRNAFSEGGSRI
jgi:hypothetical protein